MVKYVLLITADLENLTDLQPEGGCDHPNFSYCFKVSLFDFLSLFTNTQTFSYIISFTLIFVCIYVEILVHFVDVSWNYLFLQYFSNFSSNSFDYYHFNPNSSCLVHLCTSYLRSTENQFFNRFFFFFFCGNFHVFYCA